MTSNTNLTRRIRGRRPFAIVTVAALVAIAAGTVGAATAGATKSSANKPVMGGTISYDYIFEARGLDPTSQLGGSTSSAGDGVYGQTIFDDLLYENRQTNKVVPRVAKSITTTDGMNYKLEVRPNIMFTDNTPYDAAAVKFNWDRIANPANNSANRPIAEEIATSTVTGPLTLEFTLKAANYLYPNEIAKWMSHIGSPTALAADPVNFANNKPVGAGPFIMTEWVRGSVMKFDRNPNYWDKPKPYADHLEIRYTVDGVQRYNALVAGQTNISMLYRSFTQIKQADAAGYNVIAGNPPDSTFYFLNLKKLPFSDPNARMAMAYALNRKQANATLGLGYTAVSKYLFNPASGAADKSAPLPQYDKKKAQGFIDQYVAAHGAPLTITCRTSSSIADVCNFWQTQLTEFNNLKFEVDLGAGQNAIAAYAAGSYEAAQFAVQQFPDPDVYIFLRTGQRYDNYMGYSNPLVDQAFTTARAAAKESDRVAQYKIVNEQYLKDMPAVFTVEQPTYTVLAKNVKGWHVANVAIPFFADIWLAKS